MNRREFLAAAAATSASLAAAKDEPVTNADQLPIVDTHQHLWDITKFKLAWIDAPKWLSAVVYVVLGWSGTAALPQLVSHVGWAPTALLALGGALYSAGAAVYALRRPDPAPAVFGYHEVFHSLVVAAAGTHYAVVALYVLPRA